MSNKIDIAFIIGTGRCGTTLLSQFLNAHSQICVPPELQILFEHSGNGARLYELFSSDDCKMYKADDFIRNIERMCPHNLREYFDYESFFHRQNYPLTDLRELIVDFYGAIAASRNKSIFFEQVPWYGQRIDIVNSLFPKAKYIHMVRDGRDVAISFSRTPWWHNSPAENLMRWQCEITKISNDAGLLLNKNQYLEIRYEDLVLETERVIRLIMDFLGVPFEKTMLLQENHIDYFQYCKNATKTVSSSAYNNWSTKKEKAVFDDSVYSWKIANPDLFVNLSLQEKLTLVKFGYEV